MREIRSFTLSPEVVESLERIPRLERSRTVDQILRHYLPGWGKDKPRQQMDVDQVRAIVQQVLTENQVTPPDAGESDQARAGNALASILGMKEA